MRVGLALGRRVLDRVHDENLIEFEQGRHGLQRGARRTGRLTAVESSDDVRVIRQDVERLSSEDERVGDETGVLENRPDTDADVRDPRWLKTIPEKAHYAI